jgi:hypothetical protein
MPMGRHEGDGFQWFFVCLAEGRDRVAGKSGALPSKN